MSRGADSEADSPAPELVSEETELVPRGNPFRLRAAFPFSLGTGAALLLMASDTTFEHGVLVGLLALTLAAVSLLDLLGTFDDPSEPRNSVPIRALAAPAVASCTAAGALFFALRAAIAGTLPSPIAAAAGAVTGSALGLLAAGTWFLARLGVFGEADGPRQLLRVFSRSPGAWLLGASILLYLPRLGSFSLIDPWETHYGEVAREMLARRDWISLWWAHEGWFFSKPVLDFWLQGLSFALLGVDYRPGQMLAAAADGAFPQPEWAVRLPVVVLALGAQYLVYRAVSRVYGPRAGFLGGLALTTAPYWFFLAHQSMTDMPYVAPLTGALALVALGLSRAPEERVRTYEIRAGGRSVRLSLAHLLLGAVVLSALPQILYLLSRNFTLYLEGLDRGFQFHRDLFFAGSGGGNCELPGNAPCRTEVPVNPVFQPAVGALVWSIVLALFLLANRGERRVSRLCYLGAWYLAALALLAKGAPGVVLPVLVAVTAVCAARRFRDLARLEFPGAVLLIGCVALPWYVQAFMRHGAPFTDRLLFHDMYKRAFVHVHDTNVGDDVSIGYYLWQLGYGLFPWTGLAALGAVFWLTEGDEARSRRAELGASLALWTVLAFSMFAVSLTKFHHYALPLAPPLCLLTGITLDRMLGERASGGPDAASDAAVSAKSFRSALVALGGLTAAGIVLLVGRDLYTDGAVEGDARLLHLFSYNYARPWPPELDFADELRLFSVVAAVACASFAIPRVRAHGAVLLCATAAAFTAFALNVYLVTLAPHWGQRETLLTYYATRAGEQEPLVAFQMNWKGENFYTGNQMVTFVRTGAPFKRWLAEQ
ncbi:MAG TPA: glycosyltransferase family 39 protein, partial [Polyangiaceae bacterium]